MKQIQKYCFKKHSEKFWDLFKKERRKLRKIVGKKADIEHVGSSAVSGLGGKGIIDIAIAVPKRDIKKILKRLEKEGYEYKPVAGNKERRFLQKIYQYQGKNRRVHVQLTYTGSSTWKGFIAVRDFLKKYKEFAKKYTQIKKEAVRASKGEGKKYREYKDKFLKDLTKMALAEEK